ncbi:hypothetical protein FGB62_112g017 [Gracilaria domingensis]|nr:hypothetical protein FGB62_112g017 [Gracilaria domingensis]
MPLDKLFDRSPVLPPDPNISLARYLHTIRHNHQAAVSQPDPQRAALLHIRLLQLICKTLPAHPEYSLPENVALLKQLRAFAHESFEALESFDQPAPHRSPARVELSVSLLELFERIASEHTARAHCMLALLGGRLKPQPHVAALIIPSQTFATSHSSVRYETDVSQLLEVKKLHCFGFVHLCPSQKDARLLPELEPPLLRYCNSAPEAFALVIAPSSERRLSMFSYDEHGTLVPAQHLELRRDGQPAFKLYDLRPLAAARDEQQERERVEH